MLSAEIVELVAGQLEAAQVNRQQIQQVSRTYPQMNIDDAYAIQQAWMRHRIASGRKVRGHKIGLTSRAMQCSSNIDEPDYGVLLDDMFFDDGSELPADRFIVPRVEVELAFILERPLSGPHCTTVDVLDATRYVTPALEVIDARIEQRMKQQYRSRRAIAAAPPRFEVLISNDASETSTMIDVRAPDAPATLYRLSHALAGAGYDIRSAKVATLGHEVVDVFYVQCAAGKLPVDEHDAVRDQLTAALV